MPFSVSKGSRPALERALGEQEGAVREYRGSTREHNGASREHGYLRDSIKGQYREAADGSLNRLPQARPLIALVSEILLPVLLKYD